MSIDEFNEQASRTGGKWVKLKTVGDEIKGTLTAAEIVDRTDLDGSPILSRKSGKPRKVWRLTIQTDQREDGDDDGVRIFDANESAQSAIRPLLPLQPGGTILVRLTETAADSFSQATYQAGYKAPELLAGQAAAESTDLSGVL